ncbi:M16 family metallopeptidase [Alteromonas facilis]|uniref:M16 family metallopeptidase n=1 Tax=Alteromonas facilis TaxID=2048004 RepID=UPI001F0C9762|nr:pitrilysin family protein [Alteromonas facilis]
MKRSHSYIFLFFSAVIGLQACSKVQQEQSDAAAEAVTDSGTAPVFNVPYEKFVLENGLEVIFHRDTSDPVVAVSLTAHVGSSREKAQRTGFAHLFEHLLFLESENLGKGGLDQMSARIGGSGANGSTSRDWTNYFQTVPKDALEKMIWAEADKLGWFINTVTEPVLAKEKQVVKNEKRLRVDNQPYGHTSYVIDQLLYPDDHPYSWQVIGSLEDLQSATLADVKEFFNTWYVPNNATLVVAGDFDFEQAKAWVHKYFDEIPRGQEIAPRDKMPVALAESKRAYHEDNFANLPVLTTVWPTVEAYHPDEYALSMLATYLSSGKQAPFYKELVENQQLTSNVRMMQRTSELAGQMYLTVRAYEGTALDTVQAAIDKAFVQFEQDGISETDLARIKAGQETRFYQQLSSVLGKSINLARYNILAGDPGYAEKAIEQILGVTTQDIMRVYNTYIKDKPVVATSFVPKGQAELALSGSQRANVEEEQIIAGAEEAFDASIEAEYEPTPSTFDRSQEPEYGASYSITTPAVWQHTLPSELKMLGIESEEVPLVDARLTISGGKLLDPNDKPGVANLLAGMLTLGTETLTAAEFEAQVDQLGSSVTASVNSGETVINISSLARNFDETMALVSDMLLHPRWDENEYALLKQRTIDNLMQQQANPNAIGMNHYNALLYPEDARGENAQGSIQSVESITLDDLKAYYAKNYSPSASTLMVVGDVPEARVVDMTTALLSTWKPKQVLLPSFDMPEPPSSASVYFYDVPDAKQSVLYIGRPALKATDKDFYAATIMNYKLGGGSFASRLTQQLREGKGYTYGIFSSFDGTQFGGDFTIQSSVRTNITLEAMTLIRDILSDYGTTFSAEDLTTTQSYLIRSNSRAFETARAKLSMLNNISTYGYPVNYAQQRQELVEQATIDQVQQLAKQYVDPKQMIWLVVGDAKTQLPRLQEFTQSAPILLNQTAPEQPEE